MDDKNKNEEVFGYDIRQISPYKDSHGFALAENQYKPSPFMTCEYDEGKDGMRDYYGERYFSDENSAKKDYIARSLDYMNDFDGKDNSAYRYYAVKQPITNKTYPKHDGDPGFVCFNNRALVENGGFLAWGYMEYPKPLTEQTIDDYGLRPCSRNPDIRAVMREQAQAVGHWEEVKALPESERFTWHRPSIHAFDLRVPVVSPERMEERHRQAVNDFNRSGKSQKETVQGYEIQRSILFENNRGFALAESTTAPDPFVTWQFTQDEDGTRDYYWGHYCTNKDTATRDYENRAAIYKHDYGQTEKNAYKYYSTQRPVDLGTFPKTKDLTPVSIVNFDTREMVELGRIQAWGYLIYDAPLTEKQIGDYELRAAPDNPDVKQRMREQAQAVGAWEEKRGLPPANRYTQRWLDTEQFNPAQFVTPEQMAERYDYAKRDLSRADRRAAPKPIMEQLAEAAKKVERGEPAPGDKKINRDER